MTGLLFACVKPINDGNACFESSECRGGSVCVATVYGKYCMKQCGIEVIRCDKGESCLQSSELPSEGDGGVDAGSDAGTDDEIWVCLPEELEDPNYVPRDLGQVCDYSIDCLGVPGGGGVCVCIPGATCEGEGRNGPTCQRLCDPTNNQCPRVVDLQPQCTDLGTGRGFCDPTTLPLVP
jgi:hypothetical protein